MYNLLNATAGKTPVMGVLGTSAGMDSASDLVSLIGQKGSRFDEGLHGGRCKAQSGPFA